MLLTCPDRDCAHLNPATASKCEECGKRLVFLGDGYVRVYLPGHPMADCTGCVAEHRLVASQNLGRPLTPDEVVHHINGIKTDNRPENLYVCANIAEHNRIHAALRRTGQVAA